MSNRRASIAVHGSTLTLRLPEPSDAQALLELASDPEVTRWFSWGPYTTLDEPLAYVERLAAQRDAGAQLDLLVVHRELGAAGIIGLGEHAARDRRAMVGTWLGRRFWGTGVNREAKALLFRLAFETLGLERLGAYSNVDNERATRGLTGVGFRPEGVLRRWHRHGTTAYDVNVFGLLRDEWAAGPLAKLPAAIEGEPPPAFVVNRASAPS
jgi:ribosomal-protein-alanine N-acetyltransferase